MKTGKITAKLRDAVPICLMVEGNEVMRYKNIELPDELKEVEMLDFHFNVPMDGKITFEIHYEHGVLPEVFPQPRARVARATKSTAAPAEPTEEMPAENEASAMEGAEASEEPVSAVEAPEASAETEATEEPVSEEPDHMEILYNVTGIQRKNLVVAISAIIGAEPEYKAAPTFAYEIGDYTVDKDGTLTGKADNALVEALAAQGFTAA